MQVTAKGMDLEALIGSDTLTFPFFSAPEVFDLAEVTIVRDAF